jgi:iron complex outermembrane receptor protein
MDLASGAEAIDALTMRLLGWRSDHRLAGGTLLTLQSEIYDGDAGQLGLQRSDLRGGHGTAHVEIPVAADFMLRAQAIYDQTRRDIPGAYAERRQTTDFFVEGELTGPRATSTIGARAKTSWDRFEDRPALTFSPRSRTLGYYSVYAQTRVALTTTWHATAGVALERNSYTGAEFQPTLRLGYDAPSGSWMAWLGASRAVRTPSRIDRDIVAPGPPPLTVLRGSDTFRSETLDALEAGWRWQRGPGVAVGVNAFLNRYHHLRSLEPATFPVLFRNDNLLAADTAGLEANASVRLSPTWRVIAAGRLLSKDMYLLPESRSPNPGRYQGNDAKRLATLQLSWDARRNLQLDAVVRHVSELPAPVVPGYVEADFRAAWRMTEHWELTFVGRNLLHARHQEWSGTPIEYVPRSLWLSVSWRG